MLSENEDHSLPHSEATVAPMKALVYHGPGKRTLDEVPKPALQASTDAIVRISATTICGTDLHILKGDVPTVVDGRVLGHEGVGVIEEVGDAVASFRPGDKVLISCISACGICRNCKETMYSHCLNGGGWILGHLVDGTQAEFVRIPFADNSLYLLPNGVDEEAMVMLSDILPTGFEVGVLNGNVQPGDTVAIVGAGPVGLAALMTAQFYSPSMIIALDIDQGRLETARQLGASYVLNSSSPDAASKVMELTSGLGVDVAIEAVGLPATFELCEAVVAAGGRIANIGVHGKPVPLHLEDLWARNIALTTGLVNTRTIPQLLKLVVAGKIQPRRLVSHHFSLDEVEKAYDTFENAATEHSLKVMVRP